MSSDTVLKLGFVPLADAAPVIMAIEKGFYKEEGLEVELVRAKSWSQMRDNLAIGEIDAAHMLAPMVPASWLPGMPNPSKFITGLSLNLNGNAITVSNSLFQEMMEADPEAMLEQPVSARALKAVIAKRIESGEEPVTFGTVFPYSSHNYALRYWLADEFIDPDRDVRILVASPQVMVDQMKNGLVDAFCVGEPWNSLAEARGVGRAILRSRDIWQDMPEKVLAVREDWASVNEAKHMALIRAVLKTCRWLDGSAAREEAAYHLSAPTYLGVNPAILGPALSGKTVRSGYKSIMQLPDSLTFHHSAANYPWQSHALWFLCQMIRWGQLNTPVDLQEIAKQSYRADLYSQAATQLGVTSPIITFKKEGAQDRSWILEGDQGPIAMPPNRFFDQSSFDPSNVRAYLDRYIRHNIRIDLGDI